MKLVISVVICTHNPKRQYLCKVLEALKSQTLALEHWELLMIDNASTESLAAEIDLNWHPVARHIREEKLGLTYARLRGIQEAKADILVFVNDDNVLQPDYLEIAWQISKDWSILGAWGGQTLPHFEAKPPAWTEPFWKHLGIREINRDKWSNIPRWETTPIGAGLCIRKTVAEKYATLVQKEPKRLTLGRKGQLLSCGEDLDLAYTACDMGLGIGVFTSLKLLHLIPVSRLEEKYLIRLVEGTNYSSLMLRFCRGNFSAAMSWKRRLKLLMPWFITPTLWFMSPRERQFYEAKRRGTLLVIKDILNEQYLKAQNVSSPEQVRIGLY